MASNRLTQFAMHIQAGELPAKAARMAGYAETTAHSEAGKLVERARAAGLLVDPAVLQDAVAIIEEALPDIAREIIAMAKGTRAKHGQQLEAIREAWDRARGKPKQDITSGGKPLAGPTVTIYVPDNGRLLPAVLAAPTAPAPAPDPVAEPPSPDAPPPRRRVRRPRD